MVHPKATLTPRGRLLLVRRVEELNWPAAQVAEAAGVSRATVYKWLRRFRSEGQPGLQDRSSRPKRSPRALSPEQIARILKLRRGPHPLVALFSTYPPAPPRMSAARKTMAAPTMPPDDRCSL